MLLVGHSLDLIDSCEAALSNLFDGSVVSMEAILVEMLSEMPDPNLHERAVLGEELNLAHIFLVKPEADSFGENSLFRLSLAVKFVNGLKLDVKG